MGCIVCPLSGADGVEQMVDLLQNGKRVPFYKLKSGDGKARYSRQTFMGVRLPTEFSACPERWEDVSHEIALWAWNGGSIIGSGKCKSKEKGNMVDKVLMCNRWRPYKSKSPHEAPHLHLPTPHPAPPIYFHTNLVAPTLVYCYFPTSPLSSPMIKQPSYANSFSF